MPRGSAEKGSGLGLSRGLSFPIYRDWMKSFSTHALLVIRAWQDKSGGTGTKAP